MAGSIVIRGKIASGCAQFASASRSIGYAKLNQRMQQPKTLLIGGAAAATAPTARTMQA